MDLIPTASKKDLLGSDTRGKRRRYLAKV